MGHFHPYLNEGLMHYLDPTDGLKNVRNPTMDLTTVYDCTGANLGKFPVPPGVLLALYLTGSDGVPASPAQRAAHPNAVLIDQSPVNTPASTLADLIDVEPRAGTVQDVPGWVKSARINFRDGIRPGQRWPAVYVEESELTPVANALVAAGITSGVNLFLTKPMPLTTATHLLNTTGGPFPFVGIQYEFHDLYDISVVSTAWLNDVSGKPPVTPPVTRYTVQVEHYQDGFGWVLDTHFMAPAASRYRVRVDSGQWSPWVEFRP